MRDGEAKNGMSKELYCGDEKRAGVAKLRAELRRMGQELNSEEKELSRRVKKRNGKD